ncbi:MAG: hypothetical protein QXY62_01815 [Candidatus Altiarchaeota archaeon]
MELFTVIWVSISILLLLLIPGIAMSFAIFPKKDDLELLYRFGISLVLGFTPFFLLYFAEKNFFMPVNLETTSAAILFVFFISMIIWFLRRM